MMMGRPLLAAFVSYVVATTAIFGNPFAPLAILFLWQDRIGFPNWEVWLSGGILVAAVLGWVAWRVTRARTAVAIIFVLAAVALPSLAIGYAATSVRASVTEQLAPDRLILSSFRQSLLNAPREFQFFLHAAALKDCTPFAWSYRSMSYYELPPNVAVNVLPTQWIADCGITRGP